MNMRTYITLGSNSPRKLEAVREACRKARIDADIRGIAASSEQNEQPIGFEETLAGALTRAEAAKKGDPFGIAIGIESGIFRFGGNVPTTLDIAIVVVLASDGRRIIATSEGIEFPEECVKIAEARGFETTTVGSVIAEKFGGDPADPHATLTKGAVTRTMTLVDALVIAFKQL